MRSDEEMVVAAQANLLIGGVTDALALKSGGMAPRIRRAVVVYEGVMPDGTDGGGVVAMTADGEFVPADRVVRMLGQATSAVAECLCGEEEGEEDDDG